MNDVERNEELVVELGEVSEETKGSGSSDEADSPATPPPNRKP